MIFYLGSHRPAWLGQTAAPLFVSRRPLADRKRLPVAAGRWVLDSGGFTELAIHGEWKLATSRYAAEVDRYAAEIGGLDWAAPMDWMCEPGMLGRTRLTIRDHQDRTIRNYQELRERCGRLVAPVLQGWTLDDYLRHVDLYGAAGVDLPHAGIIGVGSVCRRGQDQQIQGIVRGIWTRTGYPLHAFGVRSAALRALADVLASADSMAWSSRARRSPPLPGCSHRNCANCLRYAERWHSRTLAALGQTQLEVFA